MNARQSHTPAPGPDLLARYLNVYLQSRQLSDPERPWGLGDDSLDSLWGRLTQALASDPEKLNELVSQELTDGDRSRIAETLAPLIFAFPLRSFPAELRAVKSGPRLVMSLRHIDGVAVKECASEVLDVPVLPERRKAKEQTDVDWVGHIPRP